MTALKPDRLTTATVRRLLSLISRASVVQDFATSRVSRKIAVMLQKSVVLMNVGDAQLSTVAGKKMTRGDRQDVDENKVKVSISETVVRSITRVAQSHSTVRRHYCIDRPE